MNLYRKSSGNLYLSNEMSVHDIMLAMFATPEEAVFFFKKLRKDYPYSQVIKKSDKRKNIYFSWNELTDFSTMKRIFTKIGKE